MSTRRKFLGQLAALPAAASIGSLRLFALPGGEGRYALGHHGVPDLFPHPDIIRYDAQCFTIRGQDAVLYSASFHYCRCPRELWRDRMVKLKLAGFNTIETYVFWNYHEPVEGQVDMSALQEFVALTKELGLWMILRIGPYVCAEWDAGGFPHWIIAKQFPLRSDAPESIRTSQEWFNHVLPIVGENMITRGGPVILVQIENEYDYWHIPDAQKMAYLTALAHMVWNAGVDVPIFTNWASQARQNSDPVMARIMDTGDFYPRWDVVKEVVPRLATLRREEPDSPVGIAELQGGWFSQFGGKLSEDQEGVSAAQLNLLTKTVLASGTTFLNFYMAYGGTNFEWAARKVTTTYDYAAPLREPGGTWDKYYAARTIGSFLAKFGPMLARSVPQDGATSSNPHVSVSMRAMQGSSVVFVRENGNAPQRFTLKLPAHGAGEGAPQTIPRQGSLSIGARGMKMLVMEVPIAGAHLHYSTAEIMDFGINGERTFLMVYGQPGEYAELALKANRKPETEGAVTYQHFDETAKIAVLGFEIPGSPQAILWDSRLQILVLPQAYAERSGVIGTTAAHDEVPVMTDCSVMHNVGEAGKGVSLTLQYSAGEHTLSVLLPARPATCSLDDKPVPCSYNKRFGRATLQLAVPALPLAPVALTSGAYQVERFDVSQGDWVHTPPRALETLGRIPYGYVRYRVTFTFGGEGSLFLACFTADDKQVFLNGQHVPALSKPDKSLSCPLAGLAKKGQNLLEVSYEAFGSENGNAPMAELKGIQALKIGSTQASQTIGSVAIARSFVALDGGSLELRRMSGSWTQATLGTVMKPADLSPEYTWFRTTFTLPEAPDWFAPWKLRIGAERDALLYVNGKFIGYYKTIGPQSEFYLPEPYLNIGAGSQNTLVVILAYTGDPHALKSLVVEPYPDMATRKAIVRLQ